MVATHHPCLFTAEWLFPAQASRKPADLRRYVRICDEGDEALQPEWEIDPKDLQLMEKVTHDYLAPVDPFTTKSDMYAPVKGPTAHPCASCALSACP